ncbi:cyclin-D5-3 [Lactuca sativa]|uniref:Cyclin-like domain-containing protein n=1 Tax=Lactuca sativa TaxID=4236 RepID=A0A9R1V7H2_LACSA|nr:cyclin-D5-3 [Lactuca sativa]KAJ0199616.1 hypothetical protein LSAT_V11C600339940 [Lactuca sativa]
MADSGSRSTFSLERFLSQDTALAEDEDEDELNEYESSTQDEEYLRILLDRERDRNHIRSPVDDWIKVARSEAIQWIINTRAFFRLRFHTAYLSVIYIDRFLSKGLITSDKNWAIRLLSVACLSLAAKMTELKAPALSDFPADEYNFESNTIHRMELLVSTTLDWRMHSITPFNFISCFIPCFCNESSNREFVSLTTQILLATTKDINFVGYRSSTIAMAATLMVIDQNLTKESLEMKLKSTWLNRFLDHGDVYNCYCLILELEPVKVTVSKADLATGLENLPAGTKRKRLAFNECEKKQLP